MPLGIIQILSRHTCPDLRQRFETLDRNKDGKVTLDEVPEQFRDRVKPLFERSGKQELTFDEFTRLAKSRPRSR